jgi:TonB family protein
MYRIVILMLYAVAAPLYSQVGAISHFLSPSYPTLAWQASISGHAVLVLKVNNQGSVTAIDEQSATHPLLAQEAKRCAAQWSFTPGTQARTISVTVNFGFSGPPAEHMLRPTVSADFAESSIRVYVPVNPTLAYY